MRFLVTREETYTTVIEAENEAAIYALIDGESPEHEELHARLDKGYTSCTTYAEVLTRPAPSTALTRIAAGRQAAEVHAALLRHGYTAVLVDAETVDVVLTMATDGWGVLDDLTRAESLVAVDLGMPGLLLPARVVEVRT